MSSSSSTTVHKLLGPPEIHQSPPPPIQNESADSSSSSSPFINLMVSNFNNFDVEIEGRTENGSATYYSTGNPLVDFFFHIVPDTPPETLTHRLKLAWDHDPLTALKLICHLRGVRGTGKSDKEGFYAAALWLYQNHPKTLAFNVKSFAKFGYFKDLPEILYRILEGLQVRKIQKDEQSIIGRSIRARSIRARSIGARSIGARSIGARSIGARSIGARSIGARSIGARSIGGRSIRARSFGRRSFGRRSFGRRSIRGISNRGGKGRRRKCQIYYDEEGERRFIKPTEPREDRIAAELKRVEIVKEEARTLRKDKKISKAQKARDRYLNDLHYRYLHDQIAEFFAEFLIYDIKNLNSGKLNKISLASKWCPSLDYSFDRSTLLCEAIARRIFPRNSLPEYEELEEAHYAYRIRDRLRKEVLVPLRKALELPEVFMSAKKWGTLPYNRVASVAMKNYKKFFLEHDKERFTNYLGSVERGEKKIAAGALLPHQIIASLDDYDDENEGSCGVAELQWRRMVDDLSKTGKLKDCIAVCDVSGSMSGTPMDVCVALGLLVSEMSEDPWKGKVITFSDDPQLHLIEGDNLRSKTNFIRRMHWGMSTDFQRVFDRILDVAVKGKLKNEQMIKTVFVFSDMEFNEASSASGDNWETDYQVIEKKYRKRGFTSVPNIIFWNLRDSKATPVKCDQKGVAMVSGFSKNMLKLFLQGDILDMKPEYVMEMAISGKEYSKLVVVD